MIKCPEDSKNIPSSELRAFSTNNTFRFKNYTWQLDYAPYL